MCTKAFSEFIRPIDMLGNANLLISLIVLENRDEWNLLTDRSKDSMENSHLPYTVSCLLEHNKRLLELEEESFV